MAWGLLLGGRRYDRIDYGCAITVTAGCALFVLTGSIAAPQLEHVQRAAAGGNVIAQDAGPLALAAAGAAAAGGGTWMAYGLLLLGAFLLFDGLTSTMQDKLFAQYDMHSCNQLLWVSVWSAGIRCGGPAAGASGRKAPCGACCAANGCGYVSAAASLPWCQPWNAKLPLRTSPNIHHVICLPLKALLLCWPPAASHSLCLAASCGRPSPLCCGTLQR